MNYRNIYNKLICLGRSRRKEATHKHRIIPGYAGGTYEVFNVIKLTPKEHALIHLLRFKLYGDERDKGAGKQYHYWKLGKDRYKYRARAL